MTNADIERIYKGCIDISHDAALRAVFDAGYAEGAGQSITVGSDQAGSVTALTSTQVQTLEQDVTPDA